MLLAIDTATRTASIALIDESGLIGETTWLARENHTTKLVPEVSHLLKLAGRSITGLRAIGVATGPGSFTGLRIGLSLAKGLALSLGVPIVGIPSLDGIANAFAEDHPILWACLEIGRGRLAAGKYGSRGNRAEREGDYFIGDAAHFADEIKANLSVTSPIRDGPSPDYSREFRKVLICGELNADMRSTLLSRLPGQVILPNFATGPRRASYLAELAWTRFQTNDLSDLTSLVPFYVATTSLPNAISI